MRRTWLCMMSAIALARQYSKDSLSSLTLRWCQDISPIIRDFLSTTKQESLRAVPCGLSNTRRTRSLAQLTTITMSYYFTIIGTRDNPLFEHEFGTSKAGGDGVARFRHEARHMNQFIVHSSLDIVEEVQWGNNGLYVFFFWNLSDLPYLCTQLI
jgi:hypothetical protein